MDVFVAIIAIVSALLTLSNAVYAFRLNRTKLELENNEIKRKKESEDKEIKRNLDLDNKLETRNNVLFKEFETIKILVNKLGEKIDLTNERLDEQEKKQNKHIHESDRVSKFLQLFNTSYDHSLGFFSIPDEKFKLLLTTWGNQVREYGLRYIDAKYGVIDTLLPFDTEMAMKEMINSFYNLAESIITDKIKEGDFRQWIEAKNIHKLSEILALELKKMELANGEFNRKIASYFITFAKSYSHAVGDWIKIINKRVAA